MAWARLREIFRGAPPVRAAGGADGADAADAVETAPVGPHLTRRARFLDEHILIHTHVPKTGGTTLTHALAAIVGGTRSLNVGVRRRPGLNELTAADRRTLCFVSGHLTWGVHRRFERVPLYVASTREPVARAVSRIRFIQQNPQLPLADDLQGLSLEAAWDVLASDPDHLRPNDQSRILCGLKPAKRPDLDLLWRQVDDGYFLLIPTERIPDAITALRTAFGLPATPLGNLKISRGEMPEISAAFRAKAEAANDLDAQLHDRVARDFPQRLEAACAHIARHCLASEA